MTQSDKKSSKSRFGKPFWKKTGIIALHTFKWTAILLVISGFMAAGAAFGYVSALVKDDPVRSREYILKQMQEDAVTGFAYFNDDSILGQLRTDEDRRLATFAELPEKLKDAVISIEDSEFNSHHGVDLKGFLRAVQEKVLNKPVQTGGSTITQQVARRVFLSLDRDISRKFKEILLSFRLERQMSKDEILTAYMNKVPFGNGSSGYNLYGIKAAAKGIFDVDDLSQLNYAQSAYLAGLPQQPSNFSTFSSKGEFDADRFANAVERQRRVLKRMLDEKRITEQDYEEALQFDLKGSVAQSKKKAYTTYPYLMVEVEKKAAEILLQQKFPALAADPSKNKDAYNEALKNMKTELQRGGYKVYTTIDQTIYDSMHTIGENSKYFTPTDSKKGIEQIGAVMIDNKTGAILGMLEGRDFYSEQINHATQAYRQPGSTMKPIAAYIPAMEKGAIQPGGVIDDVPLVLKDGTKGFHIPENWDDDYHGLITARKALNQSYNIPAIKLFLYDVGIKEAWTYAKNMGITSITKEDENAQTGVIGGLYKGVTVEELTNAYATIANKGIFNDAYMIRKITDADGNPVYERERKPQNVFSEETAYLMTDMMRTVITEGTATDLKTNFKHYGKIPVVGKTGSTQDDADAWFMGYSPDITLGVWAGYDQQIYKLSKNTGGTNRAKNIWALIMDDAINKKPEYFASKEFKRPSAIIDMTVSDLSGKLPNELIANTGHLKSDLFNKKFVPKEEDDVLVPMKFISYNGINYLPQAGTPEEFLQQTTVIKRKESISSILKKVSDAMEKLPEDSRKPLSNYVPLDAGKDAPSEVDPRVDDGQAPEAPTALVMSGGDRLSFTASSSKDVVGYRLYRSVNGGPYQKVGGQVVLAGDETMFTGIPSAGTIVIYYVTAVDVAGKESQPSKAMFGDGTSIDLSPGGLLPGTSTGGAGGGTVGGGKPQTGTPGVPSGLKAKWNGAAVQLTWNPNPAGDNVKQYIIYFSDKENGDFKELTTLSAKTTEFTYYSAINGGFFRISAVNSTGQSAASSTVGIKK